MVDGKVDKVPSISTLVDPTSSSWARSVLTNARLAVEVFDGTCHFSMWQSEVLDVLFQQGLDIAVEESKPEDVEERNWLTINRLACGPKDDVSLIEVCVALYSKELRRKVKQISSSGDAENEDETIMTLKGVYYSPKLKKNLIFVGTLESKGFEVRVKDGVMKIISCLWRTCSNEGNSEHVKLWHMHLGHEREKFLNLLIKKGLLKGLSSCKLDLCEQCINGKTTRVKFGTAIHKIQDNGGEYKNDLFTKFCEDEGIVRHCTVKHTPQQNGVAKYMNQTLLEKIWCMLSNARLGKEFWAEAVMYVCHLVNHLPSRAIDGKIPFKKWYGKPASDYDSLHVFGSATYYHVKKSKLDPRAKKALFMGITSRIKIYCLWCLETK
ncbi:retrovirus-related pol polyprotein from transposon TNT 1-94 [Tanacetum coccineum]